MQETKNGKRILLIGNCYTTVAGFRKEIVIELVKQGYEVYVAFPNHSHGESETGEEFAVETGCHFVEIKMNRRSINIFGEIRSFFQIGRVIKSVEPNCVLLFTIKPNVYGGMLCGRKGIPYIINITGLGSGLDRGMVSKLLRPLYIQSANKANAVLFQNESDHQYFISAGYSNQNALFVPGSGVNLEQYHILPFPKTDICTFLYTARVMKEKGIEEFLAAARAFANDKMVKFEICGDCEEGYNEELAHLDEMGVVKYHGRVSSVIPYLERCSCVVIPSFYHEGISNCLLEAAACGRPIITTNHPGCKETVDQGITGYLVKIKDKNDLIRAIKEYLALSMSQKETMGLAARKKVEKEFDRKIVVNKYLESISKIVSK